MEKNPFPIKYSQEELYVQNVLSIYFTSFGRLSNFLFRKEDNWKHLLTYSIFSFNLLNFSNKEVNLTQPNLRMDKDF